MKANRILRDIPKDTLEKYLKYELTSKEVGLLLNVNAVSVRRAIKRSDKPTSIAEKKKELALLRQEFRKSISHKTVKEIMAQAYVSESTAIRIKAKYVGK